MVTIRVGLTFSEKATYNSVLYTYINSETCWSYLYLFFEQLFLEFKCSIRLHSHLLFYFIFRELVCCEFCIFYLLKLHFNIQFDFA